MRYYTPFIYNFLRFIEGDEGGSGSPGEKPGEGDPKPSGDPKPGEGDPKPSGDSVKVNERGYPDNTPVKEMDPKHQAAYWKYHHRKNEELLKSSVSKEEYDKLKSELEKARNGEPSDKDETPKPSDLSEAQQKYVPQLVRANLRAEFKGRVPEDKLDEKLETVTSALNFSAFLGDDGDVDADKVASYAASILPDTPPIPSRKGWTAGARGADRDNARSGSHSVASAKEERLEEIRQKRQRQRK